MTRQVQSNSIRIASNTIVLFVRMFVLTVINLYAVRLVLRGLGEEDYGIFTTIGGVVTFANVVSGVLALSIQRFYSYYMGKNDDKSLNEVFSISMNIVAILSLITFLLLETIGLWFVCTQLTIPAERFSTTLLIYQFSIFTLICSIIQIPYTAAIFSNEDMNIYALISTIECLLKLIAAYCITFALIDNLSFYVGGLLATAIIILLVYIVIGRKRYPECHFHPTHNKKLYHELLSFSGWTLFGSTANTCMIQGNTILLNIFFGPIITTAFGIALQINYAFNALCNSLVLAFRPPMIKAYAEKEYTYLNQLFNFSNKSTYYILLIIAIPFILEMRTILNLWLGNVSEDVILFARFIIIYIVCIAMHSPITIIMQASGRIKEYHLPVESITMMCLPVSWIFFHYGLPAYSIFYSLIGVCIIAHIARVICIWHHYPQFSFNAYLWSFVVPAMIVTIISTLGLYYLRNICQHGFSQFILTFVFSITIGVILTYFIGINKQERQSLHSFIKKIIVKEHV